MRHLIFAACVACLTLCSCRSDVATDQSPLRVGPSERGGFIVSTRQLIRPAGRSAEYHGRPVDLALSPDRKALYVKSNASILAIETASWTIRQELKLPEKTSGTLHGIVVTANGKRVYVSAGQSALVEAEINRDGTMAWGRRIALPGKNSEPSYPCGIALLPNNRAAVCLSMNNSLAIVDLDAGKMQKEIPVGVAPYGVAASADGKICYVSNWGGRRAREGDKTVDSAGTKTVIDHRGVASTGNVGVVDVEAAREVTEIETGLHPADVELNREGTKLFVANANSDTVSVIDTAKRQVVETIAVRPDPKLPFGSASNALALSDDGNTLFVANGGNNAIAVVRIGRDTSVLQGFIPTGWYPGSVVCDGKGLMIANVKGVGSRDPAAKGKWASHAYWGSVTKVDVPDDATLQRYTQQVVEDSLVPQTLRAMDKAQTGQKPQPVPARIGEPSAIEHVVYIIKENRTFDQLFGDMQNGNREPSLCVFGERITPNQHALAQQFALLDNFYCNGVLSADGHAWATEGVAVDYLEKSFGGWTRSYPFPGNDALAFASSGFIWDNVLLHGLSFRNYGEMTVTHPEPPSTWPEIYADYTRKTSRIALMHKTAIDTLRQYSCPDSPGWNLRVPDMIRADVFLKEFQEFEKTGNLPNLIMIYLPSDHTAGTGPNAATPAAMVADNDLAVGRIVEAVSHSQFWPKTCIFAIEDDPQAGFDHVDGHRSICLAISPFTKHGAVVSEFYNQTSVLHTMELMLGLPPMNQFDAMAPVMREVFTDESDLTPYQAIANNIPLNQMNPAKSALSGMQLDLASASERLPLEQPDLADEDTLNRIVWHAMKGTQTPYPAAYAGAHGKGLKKLHLKLDGRAVDDDD